jgi:hypothetical protein
MMRASLWLLFAAATAVAIFWLLLVLASGSAIWRESNWAGLSLQTALLLFPVCLLVALRKSSKSLTGTVAIFLFGWSAAAVAGLLFFQVP